MKLQDGEQKIHELHPEKNILGIWFFSKVIFSTFFAAFITFWCFGFFGGMFLAATRADSKLIFITGGIAGLFIGISFLFIGLIYCIYLRRTYIYYITNQRCIFHGGIIRKVERSIPYHKITDVEQSQNILEQILGISTIKLFTPGTASTWGTPFGGQRAEITFSGLKDNETPAITINEYIRKAKAGPHE